MAGEYPSRVLRQVLQEFKFLERQVQGLAADAGGIARFVNDDAGSADLRLGFLFTGNRPCHGESDTGLHLGRSGGVQHNVIHCPGRGDSSHAALREDQHERRTEAGGFQQLGQ
ncbi:hypothetical protein D3C78_1681110 [compost metagenome]